MDVETFTFRVLGKALASGRFSHAENAAFSFIIGIRLAFRHPEWAQAYLAAAHLQKEPGNGEMNDNLLDALVASFPIEATS